MPAPFEEDLLRHERFLLRLARRLAGGEAEAEDLVQDAYVRALERPPAQPGALRAWLATVLRRTAGRSARGGRRREARERAAARPEAAPEDLRAVDAQLDAHAELLALLRDLPEGERQALFLRYSEGLAPPEIARRLGVPLETLKTRLRRGRERLRARLDARHGRREAWIALLVPAGAGRAPALPAGVPQALGTGLVMGATAKVAAGVALCAGAALCLWVRAGHGGTQREALRPPAQEERALELAAVQDAAPRVAEEPPAAAAAAAAREDTAYGAGAAPPAAPPAAAPWPLIVRTAGAPAQGAPITVQARLDAFGRYDAQPLQGVIGADGEASFDVGPHLAELVANAGGARPEELFVSLDDPDLVPVEASLILPDPLDPAVPPPAPLVLLLRVERAAIVQGRLLDDLGAPLHGERVLQAHALHGDEIEQQDSGGIDPEDDGTFRLRVDGEGPYALCAVAAGWRPATIKALLERGRTLDVGDVLLARGAPLDGRAVDASGRPARGAQVSAALQGAQSSARLYRFSFRSGLPWSLAWRAGAFELPNATAAAADDGAFGFLGLGPYEYRLDARAPDEEVPIELPDRPLVTAPGTVVLRPQAALLLLTLVFPDGSARDGRIAWSYAPEGLPAGDSSVSAERLAAEGVLRYALPPDRALGLELAFPGLPPASLALRTPGVGGVLERTVELAPGAAPARLVLVLVGERVEDGMPFTALLHQEDRDSDRSLDARGGELVLDDLAPGPLRVTLSAGRDRFAPQDHLRDVVLALELAPGEERRVPVQLERGGTLELEARTPAGERVNAPCRVTDAAGVELDLVFVARLPNGRVAGNNYLFESGPARAVPELPPGRYRVRVQAAGYEPEELEVLIEAGRTTERTVTLRTAR